MLDTGYRYFKAWAKREPTLSHLTPKELARFCDKVNEASNVYTCWDTIVSNLTDDRMTEIDARRLSVHQFYMCKSIEWCLSYNESLRRKSGWNDDPVYSEEKYAAIFENIVASGILEDVDNNPQVAAIIGGHLQSNMVRLCRHCIAQKSSNIFV